MTPSRRSIRQRRAGAAFTLPEMIAVMVIVATLAGVAAPVMVSASDSFSIANRQRSALDRLDLSLQRVTRLFENATASATGDADIASASSTRVVFNNGARVELLGTTLWFASGAGASAPLCQNVEQFSIQCLADDGVTTVNATPEQTRSVRLTIQSAGLDLRTAVSLRQTGLGT